ncbi:unnamed protein product [Lathyrus sativus]|nr:unnamed protein product [Lathyrus sativus]
MAVNFVTPTLVNGEIEITIEESNVIEELEFWENAMILFSLEDTLSMNVAKKFKEMSWNFVSMPDLYYNEEGYFIVRFRTCEDKENVVAQGPYFIYGKPLFLRQWTTEFKIKDAF